MSHKKYFYLTLYPINENQNKLMSTCSSLVVALDCSWRMKNQYANCSCLDLFYRVIIIVCVHIRSLLTKTKDGEMFTLDAIRSGIRFQRSVAEGWIKVRVLFLVKFSFVTCYHRKDEY